MDYAPTPDFVKTCFSASLPTAERCEGLKQVLPQAGRWTRYCKRHVLRNKTFGRTFAPYVDKLEAKRIVSRHQISGLRVAQTLAVVDGQPRGGTEAQRSIELDRAAEAIMQHDRVVVKLAHWSGGVLLGGRLGWSAIKGSKDFLIEIFRDKLDCYTAAERRRIYLDMQRRRGSVFSRSEDEEDGIVPKKMSHGELLACAVRVLTRLSERYLSNRYGNHGETQYAFIPGRILVEEFLPKQAFAPDLALQDASEYILKSHKKVRLRVRRARLAAKRRQNQRMAAKRPQNQRMEYRFWVAHGTILYVEVMCSENAYTYVSRNFGELNITNYASRHTKCNTLVKPRHWELLVSIAEDLTRPIHAFVRVDLYDLYTTHGAIYFSEFTFTPDACQEDNTEPRAAQEMHAHVMQHPSHAWQFTSPVVECIINTANTTRESKSNQALGRGSRGRRRGSGGPLGRGSRGRRRGSGGRDGGHKGRPI
jgi:hypothetical protein